MKLVVGLGNPGKKYQGTRHNVGFEVLDELARRTLAGSGKSKFNGNLVETRVDEEKLLLLYPHTYMNLSGNSVRPAFDFYKLTLPDVLVVCDDFNLPVGKLRMRPQGSSGGQKGLADVARKLGSDDVARLRVGIGPLPERMDVSAFVLSQFGKADQQEMAFVVPKAADAVLDWVRTDITTCMNKYN